MVKKNSKIHIPQFSNVENEQPLYSSFSAVNAAGFFVRCMPSATQSAGAPCVLEAGIAIENGLNVCPTVEYSSRLMASILPGTMQMT